MGLTGLPLCALLLLQKAPLHSHVSSRAAQIRSVRRFVQGFYDWYVPKTQGSNQGPAWEIAIREKSGYFAPKLINALREDLAASSKVKGYVVGLDWYPFLSSQDPASRYVVGRIVRRGSTYYVDVHYVAQGKRSEGPATVANVQSYHGKWRFTNFGDIDDEDLLTTLKGLKEERRKHPVKCSTPPLSPIASEKPEAI